MSPVHFHALHINYFHHKKMLIKTEGKTAYATSYVCRKVSIKQAIHTTVLTCYTDSDIRVRTHTRLTALFPGLPG